MNPIIDLLLTMSCVLPAIIGLINYSMFTREFKPFIWIMWLAVFAEFFAVVGNNLNSKIFKATAYNIYIPLNFYAYLLFFYRNKLVNGKLTFRILFVLSILVWIGTFIYKNSFQKILMFSQVFNCIVIISIGIDLLSKYVLNKRTLVHRAFFLPMAIGSITQSIFFIFITSFMIYGTQQLQLRTSISHIYQFVNAGSYLLFAYALLCLKKTKTYLT